MLSRRQTRPTAGGTLRRPSPQRAHGVEPLETRTLLAADVVISEFMAANSATLQDSYLEYSDWIELHNRGDEAQDLDGWFLTDSGVDLTMWRLPAVSLAPGAHLVVFASEKDDAVAGSELHTNFKLDAGGEYLALVRPDGLTVQHEYLPAYPDQTDDISYGLSFETQAGSFEEQYFTQPTPGAPNVPSAPEPRFSVASKTFTGTLAVALSSPLLPGAQIRYTTNRTVPSETSTLYTGPINLINTTMIRARAFAPGRAPSPVVSQTYFALDANVSTFSSNLPVVVLDTFGAGIGSLSSTTLSPVSAYFIDTAVEDGRAEMLDAPDFTGRGGLRLRGQTSQGMPKKPFAFETWDENNQDKEVSILGMPKESDWVLMNPYSEKTLMQNYLAYMWSNRMGQYAVRTRFVEVFVNQSTLSKIDYANDYQGVYIFMERIKIDNDRVDIAKLGPSDNAGLEVTGGYIWKKDKWDAGEIGFTAGNQTYQFFEPSQTEITSEQQQYLTNYINEFYSVLQSASFADPVNGYAKYIDVDSWIDHHIMVELTKNIDGFRLSTYYHKDRNGKIKMGPVWDYNLSLGNADYNNGWLSSGWYHDVLGDDAYPYWRRLFQDPAFQQKYIDRWQELRQDELSTDRLMADIDALTELLSDGNGNYPVGNNPTQVSNNPIVRNYKKWQILANDEWPNWFVNPSWIEHVNWTKNWLRERVEWWDGLYLGRPTISPAGGNVTAPTQVTISATGGTASVDTVILAAGAPATALVPTEDIGTSWRNRTGFNDSGWQSGTTGVGYDQGSGAINYNPLIGLQVEMRNINPTVYIRVPFNVSDPASINELFLRMKYDDAFVAYLNGTQVARTGNAPAALAWDAGATGTHDDGLAVGFVEFDISQYRHLLVTGGNVLAIHGLNAGAGSSDLLMVPEIVSRALTSTPVYYTTDGIDPRLPSGAINPAATLYTGPFTVATTSRVMARARLNNTWSGLASELYDFGTNRLRISEIMYNPAPTPGSAYLPGDFEYIELLNSGAQSMNLAGTRFTNGINFAFGNYTLGAGQRVLAVRNQLAFESRYGAGKPIAGAYTGALSDGGERVRLVGTLGEIVHDFSYSDDWYSQTDGQGWSLTIVDPNAALTAWGTKDGWRASEPLHGTPGDTDTGVRPNSVVINEIMTNPSAGGDWIELRNTTGSAINIGNWWLSDTPANLKKYRIAAGTSIPANGYLVFTEAQFGAAFSFSASGEGVFLSSGDSAGNIGGYRVDETFGAADVGVTFGRTPLSTGGADFTALVSATQGAGNAAPVIGPVVINEIMYHPLTGKAEYIELRNLTGAAINLYDPAYPSDTWKFAGGIDWAFPTGVSIPASGFVVISAVDPATLRSQYSIPAGVQVFGPYTLPNGTNVLSNGGESIRLLRPGMFAATNRPFVQVDRVAYDDELPWPAETAGTGQSLGRVTNPAAYGNDPANWAAELLGGSPGRPNLDNSPPTADVVDVAPDPRTAPVTSITLIFSEPVTGLDLADLLLTRNGSAVPLTGSQTVTTVDGGITWTLGNLGTLTSAAGTYVLTLVAAGSGIIDGGGRALAADASDTWVTNQSDTSAPSADITDVTPDPRNTSVGSVTVVFDEAVTGVDRADFILTRNDGPDLLSAGQTLASSDGGATWTISGLSTLTAPDGTYVLTLKSTGTGIADLAGNPLAGGTTEQWLMDSTRPTAEVVDVTPDPRSSAVGSITFAFSERVTGVDLADLRLTRDGGANLLTAAQTLTTPDSGMTWVLGNLAGVTAQGGNYTVRLITAGSGIVDLVGNALLTVDPGDAWSTDVVAPVADVVNVSPDPRDNPVDSITITFTEAVTGFELADLQLFRAGTPQNLLTAAQTLTTSNGVTWTLGNLAGITSADGSYTLTLVSAVSGIADAAGNSLPSDASDTWTVDIAAPTVDIVDVMPDPRNIALGSIDIVFSEAVIGVDLSDLTLTRNELTVSLANATLGTFDNNITWRLGNLAGITGAGGVYTLTVKNSGTGITDPAGNPLSGGAVEQWRMDATAPRPTVPPVTPDPRNGPVDSITIVWSEAVNGFDLSDLRLTRDGGTDLLTIAQTLTSPDRTTWTLGNLSGLTGTDGVYTLAVVAAGSGVTDDAGNAFAGNYSESWTADTSPPTADIVDVTPDPRTGSVASMTIQFSEPVSGMDLNDLRLTRDGGANLLSAAQTVTNSDGGRSWVVDNLDGVTATDGRYTLTLVAAGSGITDAAGNPLPADASDTWTVDSVAPTADIVDVTPDPRDTPVDSITVTFSESVTGFDLADLRLTRDGEPNNLLTASHTLTSSDGVTWVLGNLADVTPRGSEYTLTLLASGAGIRDAAGNALASDASDIWDATPIIDPVSEVYVRGSAWSNTFKAYLAGQGLGHGDYGFRVDDKTGNARVAPWTNVNEIVVRFSTPPTGSMPDPSSIPPLDGDRAGGDYTVTAINQLDPQTFAFVLDRALGVLSTGGENGVRVTFRLPGAGPAGTNYQVRIDVLQGDVDRSGSVLANDYSAVKSRFFQNTTLPNYTAFHDVDGSGSILANDYSAVKGRFFDNFASPPAAVAAAGSGSTLTGASVTKDLFASTPILA